MQNSLRLGNLVKEFNVSARHIIAFLADKGILIEKNLHMQLSEQVYALLKEEFKSDKLAKEKADEINSTYKPLPSLNNKSSEKICYKCDNCNNEGTITASDSEFTLQSNESFKVWLFEIDIKCQHCDEEIHLLFEIQETPMYPNAISTYTVNLTGASVIDCPDEGKPYENTKDDFDPYENFHWGGLSGEEAYIGYWNTD